MREVGRRLNPAHKQFLGACKDARRLDLALRYAQSLPPNPRLYSSVLGACAQAKDHAAAVAAFDLYSRHGLAPDAFALVVGAFFTVFAAALAAGFGAPLENEVDAARAGPCDGDAPPGSTSSSCCSASSGSASAGTGGSKRSKPQSSSSASPPVVERTAATSSGINSQP